MIQIEKIRAWTPACEAGLAAALGEDRDQIVRAVHAGALECYRLFNGAAYMVTRYEPDSSVLTVCCYQGVRAREACAWLMRECGRRGIRSLRFYTRRPALARLLKPWPFELREYVFEAQVARGAH